MYDFSIYKKLKIGFFPEPVASDLLVGEVDRSSQPDDQASPANARQLKKVLLGHGPQTMHARPIGAYRCAKR